MKRSEMKGSLMELLGAERVFASQALFPEGFGTTGLSLGLPGSPCPAPSMWLLGG